MKRRELLRNTVRLSAGLILSPHLGVFAGIFKSGDALFKEQKIFTGGKDGYHTYRIPAMVVTNAGTILAFCEGRKETRKDYGNIDLILKRSEDLGETWSEHQIVYEEGGSEPVTIGNPCPVVDRDTGIIWLPFCRQNDEVFITKSTDDGKTWESPTPITDQVKRADWSWYATGPGVGIQVKHGQYQGRLIIPCDHRERIDGEGVKHSHVFYSDDRGETWELGDSVSPHTDECQVAELVDETLMINMRNYWGENRNRPGVGKVRAVANSPDMGSTWRNFHFDEELIEPTCQASLLRYTWPDSHGKSRILFSNPARKPERTTMTIRLSYDEGKSWPVSKQLPYTGPAAYSCLTILPDMTIGCLYERGEEHAYEQINFVRTSLEWLTNGDDSL